MDNLRVTKLIGEYPDHHALYTTLARINAHYGNGWITSINFDRSTATIQRMSMQPQEYQYTLLPGDRVRFRGVVRKIGYSVR